MLEKLIAADAKTIVKAVLLAAAGGDMAAARMVLDRCLSPVKDRPVQINLGPTNTLADLDAAHSVVIAAACDGSVTPNEASALAGLLAAKRAALDHGDIERRLSELEGKKP